MKRTAPLAACCALLVLAGTLLAACGGGSEPDSTDLIASSWVLSSGVDPSGIGVPAPSLDFAAGKISGSTGCNRFSAPYELDGDRLTIGAVTTTQMACEAPADTVERRFLAALERVDRWKLDEEELELSGGGAELEFSTVSPVGNWRATSLLRPGAIKSVLPGSEITAELGRDGSLSGSAGCNTYGGSYELDGNGIAFRQLFGTEMACSDPPGVMEQEADYLEALAKVAKFSLDANGLTLLTRQGTIAATFEPAP